MITAETRQMAEDLVARSKLQIDQIGLSQETLGGILQQLRALAAKTLIWSTDDCHGRSARSGFVRPSMGSRLPMTVVGDAFGSGDLTGHGAE